MKFLSLLILLLSFQANAECFSGVAKYGSVAGLKEDVTLYFQRAGHRAAIALVDKSNSVVAGDIQCSGSSPDRCRIGGAGITFQFIENVPTLVVQNGSLEVVSDDAADLDLRIARGKRNTFNYVLSNSDQSICTQIFPQLKDVPQDAAEELKPSPRVGTKR